MRHTVGEGPTVRRRCPVAGLRKRAVADSLWGMPFDVAIFGTLALSPGDMKAWRRVVVDPAQYRVIARVFPGSPNLEPAVVGDLLKELPTVGGYDLFRIDPDGGMYSVRGQFAERPFRKYARQLAALFMSAAEVDIRGDVYFLGTGVREGYAVQLSGGRPVLATLEAEEIERRSRDPMLDSISDHFRAAPESIPPPPPAMPSPASSRPLLRFPHDRVVEVDPDDAGE
jgi:hypothetical protein